MRNSIAVIFALLLRTASNAGEPSPGSWEYLSDLQDRLISVEQGWGELGIDTCAHASGQKPLSLRVKDEPFRKGLGHHAPGEIAVDLNGEYDLFEAKVGVQWQEGNVGSVVFKIFVDGEKRFESPLMRDAMPAASASIPVQGAMDLRLAVTDGGDGITCDCADWAEARLRRSASPRPRPDAGALDIAPFARVMTWDPGRMDGARSSRIEEFRAEDVFQGSEVPPDANGLYRAPVSQDGRAALGLEWLERRRLRELGIEFEKEAPPAETVEVQGFVGESPWQGTWKKLAGKMERETGRLLFKIDLRGTPEALSGVRKVRWVFGPGPEPVLVRRLHASGVGRPDIVELRLEFEKPLPGRKGEIEVYNGKILEPAPSGPDGSHSFSLSDPLRLKLRSLRPLPASSERTVLRFRFPEAAFGVAVEDILSRGCVYVPQAGLFIAKEPSGPTLEAYKKEISGKKTVLEEVRESPDQTFEQALAKTRNPIQGNGPTLLSLACDNEKLIAEREGTVRRADSAVVPRFALGKARFVERRLQGGWLPMPVVEFEDQGVLYRELACVAPFGRREPAPSLSWLEPRPMGVLRFSIVNKSGKAAEASLTIDLFSNAAKGERSAVEKSGRGAIVTTGGRLFAVVDASGAAPLELSLGEGSIGLRGSLPQGLANLTVYLPGFESKAGDEAAFPPAEDLFAQTAGYWKAILDRAARIEVPDPLLLNVLRASQVHCLIAARNEGEGERIAPWIASMSYGPLESESNSIIRGMDFLGHEEFARRSLDFFIHRYDEKGFLTTGYTLMGTGWHLWALGEHFGLARDREWLSKVGPKVSRVCRWITEQRKKTMHLDPRGGKEPEYGLMPPGVIADWEAFACYFCLNGYYCAGLRAAAEALGEIGDPGAPGLLEDGARFRGDLLEAYGRTQARTPVLPLQDGTWVRGYPSQVHCPGPTALFFPGEDGNRSWCYDVEVGAHQLAAQGIIDAGSPEVASIMDHMEDVQFLSEGWFDYPAEASRKDPFNRGGFSKVQPYYARNAEIYAMRDEVKPFIRSYFNALSSLLNTENLTLWEHFHNAGAWCKTHETGYFLHQTRLLLVMERGDRLWLAPLVPAAWLEDGKEISVEGAPTSFGKVSYRIKSSAGKGSIEAEIRPPTRNPPREMVIRLRHPGGKPIRSATLNGAPHAGFEPASSTIRFTPLPEVVTVRVEY